jgi:RHS repeat-associated protein
LANYSQIVETSIPLRTSYYRARYYDSSVGRFISEDRIELEGGINLHRYSNDNPITLADAFGLAPNNPIDRLIQQLQNLFPGSTYDQTTNTLTVPQDPTTVQNVLLAQGYQEPGQWWNPFLYWDPIFHAGGSESRSGNQTGSFHFRQQNPICPMGGHGPFQYMGPRNKTILDQFHVDSSNPAVDPLGHILHDFLHIPRW